MDKKLQINDFVIYGVNGICKVADIKEMDFSRGKKEKYYILEPQQASNSVLYVPVNNEALAAKISRVIGKDEIDDLILSVKKDRIEWSPDRNVRNRAFQKILAGGVLRELLLLIKCIRLKRKELAEMDKSLPTTDERILKQAETRIENDFSFILGIDKSEVGAYVDNLINN